MNFGWRLTTSYQGINPINACAIDFDGDGKDELFFPVSNGKMYIWKNEELLSNYPIQLSLFIYHTITLGIVKAFICHCRDEAAIVLYIN